MGFGELINKFSVGHNLRPDVVASIIVKESQGDPFAFRFEEVFFKTKLEPLARSQMSGFLPRPGETPSLYDEKIARATSFGLMQVLGETARTIARVQHRYLTALCEPAIGIDVGCQVLRYYLNKSPDYRQAIARYNAGRPSPVGLKYADEVLGILERREYLKVM